jgi:hypothetical protein
MKTIFFLDLGNDALNRSGVLIQDSHAMMDATRTIVNLIYELNKEARIITLDMLPRPSLHDRLLSQIEIVSRLIVPFNDNHFHFKMFKMFVERKGHPRMLTQNKSLFQGPKFVHLNDEGSNKLNELIDGLVSSSFSRPS